MKEPSRFVLFFPIFPSFLFFPNFLPIFPDFWQIVRCQGRHFAALDPPVATPLVKLTQIHTILCDQHAVVNANMCTGFIQHTPDVNNFADFQGVQVKKKSRFRSVVGCVLLQQYLILEQYHADNSNSMEE